jgi:single-strand DNA-binding protein
MASFNKVILMGNLTRDPELRYTPGGSPVCSFGLAVNRRYRQNEEWKDEVCFVDITVWGRQAENCNEYLSKGRGVILEGRLQQRSWETEDGQRRSKLGVVANNVQFLPQAGEKLQRMDLPGPEMVDSGGDEEIPF